uniref:Uncharacterized protein n=1 Tax=Leersia perrieri TaxID=77586 RepID=A0A0D9XKI1_9ORYZ
METQQQQGRPPATKRKASDGAGRGDRLLAGYLAHEFLTAGTVAGERVAGDDRPRPAEDGRYEAVAVLVHGGGARVPGVVNPSQLAAWARR